MIDLVNHIEYLLRDNDCVIVPGWGAFIAAVSPATFSDDGKSVLPPMRNYSFNGSLTYSDGLLESSVMRRDGCNRAVATDEINQTVTAWRTMISRDADVPCGRMGYFSFNDEGELLFTPYEKQETCNALFGLTSISLSKLGDKTYNRQEPSVDHKVHQNANEAETEKRIDDERNIAPHLWGKRWMRIAASIALLIAMTFVLTTPLSVDHSDHALAGINTILSIKKGDSQAFKNLSITIADATAETLQTIAADEAAKSTSLFADGKYCLVVASAATQAEADRFVALHSSEHEMRVLSIGGYHRVYVASGSTRESLESIRSQMQNEYADCWICSR